MQTTLDVRPILARHEKPFAAISDAISELADGDALVLTAPFEPRPLYEVLGERGFRHESRQLGSNEFEVTFTKVAIAPNTPVGDVFERHPSTGKVLASYGLDLCCGGPKTLAEAAAAHHLDLSKLIHELTAAAVDAS